MYIIVSSHILSNSFAALSYQSMTKPTPRPTKVDCSDSSWSVDESSADQGCTNYDIDLDLLDSAILLFQNAEDCCAHHFEGLDCTVQDICRLTNSLISAVSNVKDECDNYWHPDIKYDIGGCSNSLHFPDSWSQSSTLLFDTVQDCCKKLYLDRGNHCKIYNHCSTEPPTKRPTDHPTPRPSSLPITPQPIDPASLGEPETPDVRSCESAKWHISVGSEEMACSNSLIYPAAWNSADLQGKFLFVSHADCCERYSSHDPSACGKLYGCESEVTTTLSTIAGVSTNDPGTPCVSARWHMSRDFSK